MPAPEPIDDVHVSLIHPQVGIGAGVVQCHDWHELIVVERGPYAAVADGDNLRVTAQGVVFYPAGCRHRADFIQDASCRLWVVGWRGWHPTWRSSVVAAALDERVLVLVRWLRDREQQGAPAVLLASLLAALLHELDFVAGGDGSSVANGDAIDLARTLLERNPELVWSQGELAQHVGLSAGHLCRAFKARFGLPPMAWLARCRADRALELLATGKSLAEVASRVGYQTAGGLSRAVRRFTGR